jgi:hypothetical protein
VDLPKYGLPRGQLGTIVEELGTEPGRALLAEFSDEHGHAYAFAEVRTDQVIQLHCQTTEAS